MDHLTLALAIIACCLIYNYFRRILYFFEDLRVPYLPGWPLLGNMAGPVLRRKHLSEMVHDMYNVNKEAKYVGGFDFTEPVFVLRDLELIKNIGIRHFDNFPDHKPFGDESLDPLFGANLFNLQGDRWKEARAILSPSFTISRMKVLFQSMVDCTENLVRFVEEQSDEARRMVDTKDLFSRYANDVIASYAFGIDLDSLRDPQNEFYLLGRKVTNVEGILGLKMFVSRVFPGLMKFFKIRLFSDKTAKFFTDLVSRTVKMRDEQGIRRPDMIQLMMDARDKERKYMKMDINEMTAQAFVFFFAGLDASASSTCVLAHQLAIHPEIQGKLQDEVDRVWSDYNGNPTYEAINEMVYLDAVVNEVSRMYSQGSLLDRVCRIPYELPPALPGLKPITLQPGMRLFVPVAAIHRDPKYHENPDEFIPDRYLDKRIGRNDASNLNFGIGPRSCIGSRFALMERKILIVYFLAKFKLRPNSKTCIPMRYSKKALNIVADGGFWLSIETRK